LAAFIMLVARRLVSANARRGCFSTRSAQKRRDTASGGGNAIALECRVGSDHVDVLYQSRTS